MYFHIINSMGDKIRLPLNIEKKLKNYQLKKEHVSFLGTSTGGDKFIGKIAITEIQNLSKALMEEGLFLLLQKDQYGTGSEINCVVTHLMDCSAPTEGLVSYYEVLHRWKYYDKKNITGPLYP